ncbi:MAG: hypothetical protein ACRERS_01965, partial [Methylococcales bacterium]
VVKRRERTGLEFLPGLGDGAFAHRPQQTTAQWAENSSSSKLCKLPLQAHSRNETKTGKVRTC